MSEKNQKILIIEDEKPLSRALELKLSNAGFDTAVANDGEEALELFDSDVFDLVILDLVMPNMDGFKFLEELQNKKNSTPIVVLSNLGQAEDEDRVMSLGAVGFFVKSDTSLAALVQTVEKLLQPE